ncbi:MAG: Ldh family oxidoreductase [Clostridia bacterium]|nr:Ldh family oxidoreductase [Clostridia bacterium]
MRIAISEIKARAKRLFERAGLLESDAEIITNVLLETEMRGVFTHGFLRLPRYISCMESGGIKKDGKITVDFDSPSWAAVNGNDNLGILISYKAMQLAIEKARATGIGVVNVRGSHHFGAAGYYTSMCADANMAGVAMSNGDILVAATGAAEKTIGNNPFSYAFPAGKYGKIVYDVAMSNTSDQKVIRLEKEGKPVPLGWIIDKNGNPTTDASEYMKGGTLLPFGGYKGYGLAMMVEVFAGTLSGAAMTGDVHAWNQNPQTGGNVGHMFMAIDLAKLGDPKCYNDRVEKMIDEIKAAKKAEGVEKIYYPGEIEQEKMARCLADGYIDINDETMATIVAVEEKYGL